MSDPPVPRLEHFDANLTEPSPGNDRELPARRVRLAGAADACPGFTHEMSCLPPARLRLAIAIILAAFPVTFLRHLLLHRFTFAHRRHGVLTSGRELGPLMLS